MTGPEGNLSVYFLFPKGVSEFCYPRELNSFQVCHIMHFIPIQNLSLGSYKFSV